MSRDTRRYEHRQWDALIGTEGGLQVGADQYLAARTTPGTIALAATSGIHNLIAQVHVSHFGSATGTSTVSIQHGGTTVWQAYLAAGNNTFTFSPPRLAPANTAVQVVVSPGGGTSILNVLAGTTVPAPYRVQ